MILSIYFMSGLLVLSVLVYWQGRSRQYLTYRIMLTLTEEASVNTAGQVHQSYYNRCLTVASTALLIILAQAALVMVAWWWIPLSRILLFLALALVISCVLFACIAALDVEYIGRESQSASVNASDAFRRWHRQISYFVVPPPRS